MVNQYTPAGDPDAAKLNDKLNGLAAQVAKLGARAKLLDEGFTAVHNRTKRLEEAQPLPGVDLNVPVGEDEEEEDREPDWLQPYLEPADAEAMLRKLLAWLEDVHRWLPRTRPLPECWPWHPGVVQELLALAAQRELAYGSSAHQVSDFLLRFWPEACTRLYKGMQDCGAGAHHHRADGDDWTVDVSQLHALCVWWCEERVGTPPGLTKVE